jgi:hypothetical protein
MFAADQAAGAAATRAVLAAAAAAAALTPGMDEKNFKAGLRIRIQFIRIRIQLQHFRLNTAPGL